MLVYGAGQHFLDMNDWHPEFMEQIECVFEKDEQLVIHQIEEVKAGIVAAGIMKNLPAGTRVAISDCANYDVRKKEVLEINSGLECISLDEECAGFYISRVARPQPQPVEERREESFDAGEYLKEREVRSRIFLGADIKVPAIRRRLRPHLRQQDILVDMDGDCRGIFLDNRPVYAPEVLREAAGRSLVVVLGQYNNYVERLRGYGLRDMEDFVDGSSLFAVKAPPVVVKTDNRPLAHRYEHLKLPETEKPLVSIIIPVHNNWDYTYGCIKSIIENTDDVDYEVILADDASTDFTIGATAYISNLRVVRNDRALGFLLNTEKAARVARGKYIHFLNNDTLVKPKWLSSMVNLMEEREDVGLVGSMLLYPDGTLQEAGAIVWKDAEEITLYGRNGSPNEEEYLYVREVDYCSGASVLISKKLWQQLGGFDKRYIPNYCEDNDLCFQIRQAGYKVMYQPASCVVHFEGASNGRDLGSGLKQYQVTNGEKLKEKWKKEFAKRAPSWQDLFYARDRSWGKKTILVLDMWTPEWDQNAGARTVYDYMRLYLQLGMHVILVSDEYRDAEPYTSQYRQMGIEVLTGPGWNIERFYRWLDMYGKYIDYAYLQRPATAIRYYDAFREKTNAKIIYYPHDLKSLREERQYRYDEDPVLLMQMEESRKLEDKIFPKADVIHVLGHVEKQILMKRYPGKIIRDIPAFLFEESYLQKLDKPKLKGRNGLIFIGSFHHTPNEDGMLWFMESIYPLIEEKIPGCHVYIVGSHPSEAVEALASENVTVTGWVSEQELAKLYEESRVAIIPLRYGAGVKGKLLEAMAHQVPIVTTSIGAEGYPKIQKYIGVADKEADFAACVVRYLQDDKYWQRKADDLLDYVKDNYTFEAAKNVLLKDITL